VLRIFFKYDRALLSILFKAAWGALSQVLGIDERELAAIFTAQTAGEALNFHPHLHGLLADGYWKDGVFTRFSEIDLAALTQAFAERRCSLMSYDKLEFLATLTCHIPKPYESVTRYYGRYSCRRRGERAKRATGS
jgi:hypothetical protein